MCVHAHRKFNASKNACTIARSPEVVSYACVHEKFVFEGHLQHTHIEEHYVCVLHTCMYTCVYLSMVDWQSSGAR